MNEFLALVEAHPYITGAVCLWLFSAFVSGMPEPTPTSGTGYVWFYRSLHWAAANIPTAIKGQPVRREWTPEQRAAANDSSST